MSPISASTSRAKNSPMPGIVFKSFTLPLAFVIADRGFRLLEPPVDVADELKPPVDLDTVDLQDMERRELLAPGLAEQVAQLPQWHRLLRIAVEHRHDPVLHHRAHPHVEHPLPKCNPKFPSSFAGRPGLRHKIGPKKMRQHRRVDLVRLDLRVGNRLHLQRMRQHDIVADVVEPVVHHHPVTGGFHHRMAILPIPLQKRAQRLVIVLHPAGPQRPAA